MQKLLHTSIFLCWLAFFSACESTDKISPGKAGINDLKDTIADSNSGSGVLIPSDTLTYLALGDSYTVGAGVKENDRWPNILVRKMRENGFKIADAQIIARSGWTTRSLLYAIPKNNIVKKYDIVSLMIGVNNQYGGSSFYNFQRDFEALLDSCIHYAKTRKGVFVLSIPDYGATPFGSNDAAQIGIEIDAYNMYIKATCRANNIPYFNITDISRKALDDPSLLTTDDLHPSGEMYGLWVEKIYRDIINRFLL